MSIDVGSTFNQDEHDVDKYHTIHPLIFGYVPIHTKW